VKRDVAAKVGYEDCEDFKRSCEFCGHRDKDRPNRWVKWCGLHNYRIAGHKICKSFKE
jgi:hypothetical protein